MMFRGWETVFAIVVGALLAVFARPVFFDKSSAEIVTVLGVIMAALVPSMILAATAVRAGNFSVASLRLLSAALDRQISLFGGLFLYGLLAAAVVISGKSVSWDIPPLPTGISFMPVINLSWIFNFAVAALLTFLALRSVAVIAGIRSVLRLSATLAESEAIERDRKKRSDEPSEIEAYKSPGNYGEKVELPN